MKRLLFVPMTFLFLISCGTKQVKPPPPAGSFQKAQWETKAVLRDLKANKSHTLDIAILGDYPQKLRMEVSALMGTQVASLAMNDEQIRYAIYPQKKFFEGKASEGSFLPLMNVPLHPRNFIAIAYDTPIEGAGWSCTQGPDSSLQECVQSSRGLKVQWQERTSEGQKRVLITGPAFEMKWLFRPPRTEVQFKDDTFLLEPPSEFKTIHLK